MSALKSRAIDFFSERHSDNLRRQFSSLDVPLVRPHPTHSHGEAAATRSMAVSYMDMLCNVTGMEPFSISMSTNDMRLGRAGNRLYYDAKDLAMDYRNDKIKPNHLICMVDVDYYVDMPQILLDTRNSFLLYTVTPETTGGLNENGYQYFKDNVFHEVVSGGAKYSHELWDYSADTISVYGWRGMTYVHRMFKVEKRAIGPSRSLVLLQEASTTTCCGAIFASQLNSNPMVRLKVTHGHFNLLTVVKGDKTEISISRNGSAASVLVPIETFHGLLSVISFSGKHLTRHTVDSYLTDTDSRLDSAILTDYLKSLTSEPVHPSVSAINRYGVASYQYADKRTFDETAIPVMVAFMQPMLGDSPSPSDTINNDRQCVEGRINKVQHKKPLKVTKFMARCITEYTDECTKGANLTPIDAYLVYDKQSRPTQRHILETADQGILSDRQPTISSFMKKEAYGKVTDPRNISTVPPNDKLAYSRFIYAVSEWMKQAGNRFNWYAFGLSPLEIATDVARLCSQSDFVSITDFSRMDGRKSNVGRLVFTTLLMKLFRPEHHEELSRLMDRQVNLKGWTKWGILYFTLWTQLSGAPDTSLSNSFETNFMVYMAARLYGLEHYDAWTFSCMKSKAGGDDGIVGDLPPEYIVRSAKMLGHILTCDVVKAGNLGVNFLSRYYSPRVWNGDPSSMCDFRRQMMKFHTTSKANASGEGWEVKKLREKALSYYLTDRDTPILGEFCATVLAIDDYKVGTESTTDIRWWSRFSLEDQFPQLGDHSWMVDVIKEQLPNICFETFDSWIAIALNGDLEGMLRPPLLLDEYQEIEAPPGSIVESSVSSLSSRSLEPPRVILKATRKAVETQLPVQSSQKKKKRRGKRRSAKKKSHSASGASTSG